MTRILRLLLIAAVAWPICHPAAAQEVVPPEDVAVKLNALNDDGQVESGTLMRKAESPQQKKISVGASVSKVRLSKDFEGKKTHGMKAGDAFNHEVKTGKPGRTSAPKLNVIRPKINVPDGYALIVFVANDVWGDGSGYQMLIDQNATMYASWNSNGITQSLYDMAEYKMPENADYNSSGNVSNMLIGQTGQVAVPAGTYDILILNPTPDDKVYAANANGNIGGRIDDYTITAGNVYTFTVSIGSDGHDQTDVEITSVADALGQPTNLTANPSSTSAEISWEAGLNNDSWNLRYRPYTDIRDYNRSWDFPVADETTVSTGGWMLYDNDGDGNNWAYSATDSDPVTDACLYSQSWISGTGAVTPDNWTISPEVKLGGTFKFKARTNGYTETLGVYIYQGELHSISASNLVQVGSDLTLTSSNTTFAEYTYDLSAYTGYGYIIIRHYNCSDGYNVYVDDIQVIVPDNQEAPAEPEWTYVNNATSPYTITGLTPETQYEVQVQGVGNNTTTDWTSSVVFTTLEGSTKELNFGSVNVNSSSGKTLNANILNESSEAVQATITVESNPPFSVTSTTVTLAANALTSIPVTFTPTDARNYNGTLTVTVNGVNTVVVLKGVGSKSGPEAIRDEAFFDGISYEWTDSEGTHTSKLSEVATKPEQIIAMLKEVYTNKDIPGNFKRGCSAYGNFNESFSDVSYPAIGTLNAASTSTSNLVNPDNYTWYDKYGWGINTSKSVICKTYTGYSSSYPIYYAHFDQTEYKPENEGVTLLLVETVDGYDLNTYTFPSTSGAQYLKDIISTTIKSVRVVTQAKRVGTGEARGSLFNIDCDKMNKFFMMAKGQLRRPTNSMRATGSTISSAAFCPYPMYMYSQNYYGYSVNKYVDDYNATPFYQMFEQFSPVSLNTGANLDDLYNSLTQMTTFNVVHDCIAVPFATHSSEGDVHHGHQFMMYGVESGAADCQDVRDLMFFVPDYRMMDWGDDDGTGRDSQLIPYTNYNQSHAPKMGLYVIKQDPVEAVTEGDTYYKLKLTWDSNMDEFLPGEQQEYQLYQVINDEFGVSKWVPVYKRNDQGQYWNPTTNTWQADTTGAEPIVLTLNPSSAKKTYSEVYELREQSSRYVTYAIRGCDTGHFLSLQMSNEQSYLIEGLDPAEMAMLSSATIYSRFEAQDVRNCYSNKLQLKSSPQTIKASYLPNGSTMTINRTHRIMQNNQSVEVTEPIATLTINTSSKKFTVSGSVLDANVENLFPKGSNDGLVAGYHANNLTNNQVDYSTTTVNGTEYINFDISLWDNFVAEVSNNDHPGLYIYQLKFNTAENFDGLHGSTNEAYSNFFPVFVYKTDSRINEPLTLAQVDGDTGCSDEYKPGDVEFDAHVMLSSKTEILRYDAYRWPAGQLEPRSIVIDGGETDADEEDADPNGIAGNQGGSYSITMNAIGSADYYVGDPVSVTTAEPWNWATFVDYYPAKNPNAIAYVYAPVVELFTRGYQEGSTNKERTDYNTYGGPLQEIAIGKLHFNVMSPDATLNPLMSAHSWDVNGKKYAYYNIKLDIDKKKVPEGYEIYKVRAWREIPESLQGEEYSSLSGRMGARVLFEDITYPGCDGSDNHQVLGEELKEVTVTGADQTSHTYTSYTGTFGARKLRTEGPSETGVIDELPYKFIVRIYFTKQDNLQTTQNGASGQKAGNPVLNEDAKFYVAEYEFEDAFDSTNVPTAIQTLNAKQVVSEKYYNVAGIESDTPFKGVNIVVTRYSDGSTTTTKILK